MRVTPTNLLVVLLFATATPASAVQRAAPTGAGVLAGHVIDAVTRAPVANTLIGVSRRTGPGPNTTPSDTSTPLVTIMADGQGRFVVTDVPEGSYLVLATAPGYMIATFGQRRPAGPTHTLDLGKDEMRTDLVVPVWRRAAIAGTVIDEAGEPVVGVTVRALRRVANGPGGQHHYAPSIQTTTDDRGDYRLTEVPPGEYLVCVPQTQVTVASDIVDTFLQSVAASARHGANTGLLELMSAATALPSIGVGIRSGDLLLESSSEGHPFTMPPPAAIGPLVYPMAYYATGESPQVTFVVAPGEERRGIDIHLAPARGVPVFGTVIADGTPAAKVVLRLVRVEAPPLQNDLGFESGATVTAADGTFTFLGIPPGRYVLKALRTPKVTLSPSLAGNPALAAAYRDTAQASMPVGGAQLPLIVGDDGVRDLAVVLTKGATLTGKVVFDGDPAPPPAQVQSMGVLLSSDDGGVPGVGIGAGIGVTRVSADGTFSQTAPVPGRYFDSLFAAPAAWVFSGITLNGDVLDSSIDLSGGDVTGLTITYTNKGARVIGTARTSTGLASANADIVVFPSDRKDWVSDPLNPRKGRIEQVSTGGVFDVRGLLPGDYFIAAVDDADMPEVPDVPFFAALMTEAQRLTLSAGETHTQDLVVRRIK